MTPERWSRVREIFDGVLERPPRDRAAYLRVVCAGDDEARHEVESLLASHEDSTDFLETPAVNLAQAFVSSGALAEDNEYPAGYRLGPYQFDRRIGRGGMGSVWLATRFDPEFNRSVAIKMVKRGMDSQEILRRFRMERQMLASLDHPNIALLIDGGSTPDGLPYLVMEYIEGTPIDRYCEDRKLSITERLKLFRAVCSAVQYAHQNLVVHRDIKASNILVTGDGVAKLLDFGIAKLLRTDSSAPDLSQTRPEMRPMTLDYASPEQVRGDAITTATDIYSLGVLLYRLLTGKMPRREARSRAVRQSGGAQSAVAEIEILPPSAVVLADQEIAIPEATQKLEIGGESRDNARKRLRRKLQGDLDMIVLKALRAGAPGALRFRRAVFGRHSFVSRRTSRARAYGDSGIPLGEISASQRAAGRGGCRGQRDGSDRDRRILPLRKPRGRRRSPAGAPRIDAHGRESGRGSASGGRRYRCVHSLQSCARNRAGIVRDGIGRRSDAVGGYDNRARREFRCEIGRSAARIRRARYTAFERLEKAREQYRQLAPGPETQAAIANVDRMIETAHAKQ